MGIWPWSIYLPGYVHEGKAKVMLIENKSETGYHDLGQES